jgi:hypothetical protein
LSAWIRVGRWWSKVTAAFRLSAVDGKGRNLSNSASWGLRRGRLLRWSICRNGAAAAHRPAAVLGLADGARAGRGAGRRS